MEAQMMGGTKTIWDRHRARPGLSRSIFLTMHIIRFSFVCLFDAFLFVWTLFFVLWDVDINALVLVLRKRLRVESWIVDGRTGVHLIAYIHTHTHTYIHTYIRYIRNIPMNNTCIFRHMRYLQQVPQLSGYQQVYLAYCEIQAHMHVIWVYTRTTYVRMYVHASVHTTNTYIHTHTHTHAQTRQYTDAAQ